MTHPFMDSIQSAFTINIYIYGTHFVIFHHHIYFINLYIYSWIICIFESGSLRSYSKTVFYPYSSLLPFKAREQGVIESLSVEVVRKPWGFCSILVCSCRKNIGCIYILFVAADKQFFKFILLRSLCWWFALLWFPQ